MFIGDLSVNVPSSITMTYIAGEIRNQTYPIEVEYSYRLSTSQTYSDKIIIPVRVTLLGASEQPGSATPPNQNVTNPIMQYLPIIAGVVIIVALVIVYRNRRRGK